MLVMRASKAETYRRKPCRDRRRDLQRQVLVEAAFRGETTGRLRLHRPLPNLKFSQRPAPLRHTEPQAQEHYC